MLVELSQLANALQLGWAGEPAPVDEEFLPGLFQCVQNDSNAFLQTQLFAHEFAKSLGIEHEEETLKQVFQWIEFLAKLFYAKMKQYQLYANGVAPYELLELNPGLFLLVRKDLRMAQIRQELCLR